MHLSVSKVSKAKDVTKMTSDNDEGIFMDLVDNMPTDAWQSSVAGNDRFLSIIYNSDNNLVLLCMTAICAAFMFDLRTVYNELGVLLEINFSNFKVIVVATIIASIICNLYDFHL